MATKNAKVQIGTNIDLYHSGVDEALQIAKCIGTEVSYLCDFKVIYSVVIFKDVHMNTDVNKYFPFMNNNKGIKVILEDLDTFKIHPELLNPDLDLLTLDRNKYTLNQILAALRVRNYGNRYKPEDNIYVVSKNVSRSQDINDPEYDRLSLVGNIEYNFNFLLNLKRIEGLNLKTLQLCKVYPPHYNGSNVNYFVIDCGFGFEIYARKKYISIGVLPRYKKEPNTLFPVNNAYIDNMKDCYLVSHLDGNLCNISIRNLGMIAYGVNTKHARDTQALVYYMFDNKSKLKYGPYNSPKDMIDMIIIKQLYPKIDAEESIYTICDNVAQAIHNNLQYGNLTFEMEYDLKIIDNNKVAHNKKLYDYHIQDTLNELDILTFETYAGAYKYLVEVLHIEETSAQRYLRNAINPTSELDLIGNRFKVTATLKQDLIRLWKGKKVV